MPDGLHDLPDPGDRGLRRYSRRALPAYRYVPGLHPHPTRHPAGHSYQPTPSLNRHAPWNPDDWRTLDDWLYGVDLFNLLYLWEAHEAWEGLWAATERESPTAAFLQGLIQVAAALLKSHMQVLVGARMLAQQGLQRLDRAAAAYRYFLGLDVPAVAVGFRDYLAPLELGILPAVGPNVPVLTLDSHTERRCGPRRGSL